MNKHLFILYFLSLTALLLSIVKIPNFQNTNKDLVDRVKKVEFYQEASRIMNNLIGFDQVNNSFSNNSDQTKHCAENKDLLIEWGEDVSALSNLNSDFVSSNNEAKSLLDSIKKLYDDINSNCLKISK